MIAITGLFIRMNQLQNNIIALVLSQSLGGQSDVGLSIGTQAPDFALPDTNGRTITLQELPRNSWILLGFSSISCPVCTEMYPHLNKFSDERDDIQIALISKGTSSENQDLVDQQGFSFPVLILDESEEQVIQDYEVPGTPFFYLIDENGTIQDVGFANTKQHLQQMVEGVLGDARR